MGMFVIVEDWGVFRIKKKQNGAKHRENPRENVVQSALRDKNSQLSSLPRVILTCIDSGVEYLSNQHILLFYLTNVLICLPQYYVSIIDKK
jgi:hypothetical protein